MLATFFRASTEVLRRVFSEGNETHVGLTLISYQQHLSVSIEGFAAIQVSLEFFAVHAAS